MKKNTNNKTTKLLEKSIKSLRENLDSSLRASIVVFARLLHPSLRAIFEENFLKLCFKKFSSKIASQTSVVFASPVA